MQLWCSLRGLKHMQLWPLTCMMTLFSVSAGRHQGGDGLERPHHPVHRRGPHHPWCARWAAPDRLQHGQSLPELFLRTAERLQLCDCKRCCRCTYATQMPALMNVTLRSCVSMRLSCRLRAHKLTLVRRRGRVRGLDGRSQPAETDAGAWRAALHRRHHAGRVPQVHREGACRNFSREHIR